MNYSDDIEHLTDKMTSFYKDFLPLDSSYEGMLETYIRSFLNFWQEANYLQRHITLETSPTLHTIPYSKIYIEKALYSKEEAVRVSKLPTLEQRIKYLDDNLFYSEFKFRNPLERNAHVCDLNLNTHFEEGTLELYADYFVRDNKLYLLPSFIIKNEYRNKVLHAHDIKVDNQLIEQKWGSVFDIETGPLLPRGEFQNVVSAFRRLLSSDLTIKDIKSAISLATSWEQFDVRDRHSPGLPPQLKRLYDEWWISPAKFLVTIPEELIADKMRLNILLAMLNEAKEEHLSYYVIFGVHREDTLDPYGDSRYAKFTKQEKEMMFAKDSALHVISVRENDRLFKSNRYDVGRRNDKLMDYDKFSMSDYEVTMDREYKFDENVLMDRVWANNPEHVVVKHIQFPEIPRDLIVEKEEDGKLHFLFANNKDGTMKYELWASKQKNTKFLLVDKVDADRTQDVCSIIYDDKGAGMRYYKIRAVANNEKSCFTLTSDATEL